MRTIISLFLTLLAVGSAAPVVFTFTVAGCITLREGGHDTLATFLPWMVLVVAIIITKLIYKAFRYLFKNIFG